MDDFPHNCTIKLEMDTRGVKLSKLFFVCVCASVYFRR